MIELIKGFPYDNTYDYVKTFNTKLEQDNYFNAMDKITIDDTDYIKDNQTFLVPYNYDELVFDGVNYICFNNGFKDVYGFIIAKEYVNEEATRINYEIDVIQTFMFDITINKSFVERKNCSIDEISDFDEGLEIGEYNIVENTLVFDKDSTYFAMFNGFKEQQLMFDENQVLKSVVDLPYSSSKPLTVIDGVQYPLYFMALKDENFYKPASYEKINVSMVGETKGGNISAKILRFIKGYEGFAAFPNYFNGESFKTGGYGVTEAYQPYYYNLLGNAPYTERRGAEILDQLMRNEFASNLYVQMLIDGLIGYQIIQNKFDAFVSLAYNAGIGGCQSSPMYAKFIANPNDTTIYDDWLGYRITSGGNVLQGLVDRRLAEATIFKDGIYTMRTITSYDMAGNASGTVTDNNGNGYIPTTVNGGL